MQVCGVNMYSMTNSDVFAKIVPSGYYLCKDSTPPPGFIKCDYFEWSKQEESGWSSNACVPKAYTTILHQY